MALRGGRGSLRYAALDLGHEWKLIHPADALHGRFIFLRPFFFEIGAKPMGRCWRSWNFPAAIGPKTGAPSEAVIFQLRVFLKQVQPKSQYVNNRQWLPDQRIY